MISFVWDHQEHLLRAGELHNSSASSPEAIARTWERLKPFHLNCVLAPVAWEQVEAQEGCFCFTLMDELLRAAVQNHHKLILLWFGAWKNGASTYAPIYVKSQPQRFACCRHADGSHSRTLSPFCEAVRQAESRAFAALMRHLHLCDPHAEVVIAVQVDNEVGFLGGVRDTSDDAQSVWNQGLPPAIGKLYPDGNSWGSLGHDGEEAFMAWGFAQALEALAKVGKAEHSIPMFANAWTQQYEGEPAQLRPCGGPSAHMVPVWRIAAPTLDAIVPDCYLMDLHAECQPYRLPHEPLLISELRNDRCTPAMLLYAFGALDAVCAAPFGIDGTFGRASNAVQASVIDQQGTSDEAIAAVYRFLEGLEPLVLEARGNGRVRGLLHGLRPTEGVSLGGYHLWVAYQQGSLLGGALICSMQDGEYYILGVNVRFSFYGDGTVDFVDIQEGEWKNDCWNGTYLLNGDEQCVDINDHVKLLRVRLYTR